MANRSPSRRLLVFAKEPQPGRVKTRLIPALGPQGAAAMYRRLLQYTLDGVSRLDRVDRELWCDGDVGIGTVCRRFAERYGLSLRRQQGADLGVRMHHALAAESCDAGAVLIGSDCPGYDAPYLLSAFDALKTHDAVLGPALDGGYVLIGMKQPHRRLFEDVAWSGPQVLEQTRARLRELKLRWHELPPLRDLDRPEDLAFLPVVLQPNPPA